MPYCSHIYNSINIDIDGRLRPCCRYAGGSSKTHFPSFIMKIQQNMKNGWDDGCLKCRNEENAGIKSLRLKHSGEKYVDISHNNLCNMMCIMCSGKYSSLWQKIDKTEPTKSKIEDYFQYIDNETTLVRYIGGEPFISKDITKLFKYMIENQYSQNITFKTNTNCSVFPYQHLDMLKAFKDIEILLSIDAIGERASFVRYGKNWNVIEQNIHLWQKYFPNKIQIAITVHAANIENIKETEDYFKNKNITTNKTILTYPEYLSINCIPDISSMTDDINILKYHKYNGKYHKYLEYIDYYKGILNVD